jgi:hypothetical protein
VRSLVEVSIDSEAGALEVELTGTDELVTTVELEGMVELKETVELVEGGVATVTGADHEVDS